MKTKKFLMTSLLVMGMIIAKAAPGYPPELVLVSQPVLTYNANSVTIYYDVQNIGDYTYRGDLYVYLDPDNGYCYANEYMRICAGCIRRIAVSIPAYRPNPSITYTVMPYYELNNELYSFTTFEYFEPVRFCWYGYHNEPWVVIHVGPRPRHYVRPGDYRYYYDGYRPMLPPPPPGGWGPKGPHGMPPMDPHHHTYSYHHTYGGYPANYHPEKPTPGYNAPEPVKPNNGNSGATVVRPNGSNTPGSMSTNGATTTGNNNSSTTSNGNGATTRPSSNSSNNNSGTVSRPNTNTSGNNGSTTRPSTNTSTTTRPSSNSSSNNSGTVSRPSSNSSGNNSGTVSRPSSNSSGNSNSGRSGNSSGSSNRSTSSSSSSSRGTGSSSGRR